MNISEEAMTRNLTLFSPGMRTVFQTAGILNLYILPVVIFSGLAGNAVSIVVFASQEFHRFSSSVYVCAVLTSDTGFLLSLLTVWLEVLGVRANHKDGLCQFLVFLPYVCSFLSVWYVVCIAVESYITICHPARIVAVCTRQRASAVCLSLAAASLALHAVHLFTTGIRHGVAAELSMCDTKSQFAGFQSAFTYVDSVVTLLVPTLIITLLLALMSVAIAHNFRWRRGFHTGSTGQRGRRPSGDRPVPQIRVAKMLFALSAAFLVLNTPSHVTRLYFLLRATTAAQPVSYQEALTQLLLLFISYLNYSSKFYIFLVFSKNFRHHIKHVFVCLIKLCKAAQARGRPVFV